VSERTVTIELTQKEAAYLTISLTMSLMMGGLDVLVPDEEKRGVEGRPALSDALLVASIVEKVTKAMGVAPSSSWDATVSHLKTLKAVSDIVEDVENNAPEE